MKWHNLLKNKCPSCSYQLVEKGEFIVCSNCKYRNHKSKFASLCCQIAEKDIKRRYNNSYNGHQDEEQNLSMLNNL